MALTLANAKKLTTDAVQIGVIDEFRKASPILEAIPFDYAAAPVGNGATVTYGYNRTITPAAAGFRAINSEYAASEAVTERYNVDLKPFGGSYELDRVVARLGGIASQVAFQSEQKIKSTVRVFHDAMINGDTGTDANAFDGLDKALLGSSTEYRAAAIIDLSTANAIDTNYKLVLDELDLFLALLNEKPDALMCNRTLRAKLNAVARRSGYFSQMTDAFGKVVEMFNGIPLVDPGDKPASSAAIVGNYTRTIGAATTNLTDLYAVKFGLDAFHAITLPVDEQNPLVKVILPKWGADDEAGAVKKGEVEMVAAVALKATKSAGVFRNFKIA